MHIHAGKLAVAIVLVVAWMAPAMAQESYTLQYKFEKGQTYHYTASSNSKVDQEMAGQQMHAVMDARFLPRIIFEGATPEGNLALVYAADSAVTHIKAQSMDSTMVLNSLVGKRTRLVVTPKGETVKREIIDSVKMDRMMTGMGLRELIRLPRLAAGSVKMGDKWNATQIDTNEFGGGKIVITSNLVYTLAGKEKMQGHNCLKITYTGASTTAGKGSMMGMEFSVEGTGKSAGTVYFDPAKGLFVRNEAKMENETTTAATGQQSMIIPSTVSTETVLSLKE